MTLFYSKPVCLVNSCVFSSFVYNCNLSIIYEKKVMYKVIIWAYHIPPEKWNGGHCGCPSYVYGEYAYLENVIVL